jgi:NAD(P)-dependent dehydrogenase (short-subunit alcohol dehydrogenase family)
MSSRYAASHANPQGPGDARPTALQIIQDENIGAKLLGKTILITGCSSGLGIEIAKALHTTGAILYLTARNIDKAKTALGDLVTQPNVHLLKLDLNSLSSVRACVKEFLSQSSQLNIFIANAGVMATPEGRTEDGFETQFGTNHLSHFLLFNLLKSTLLASSTLGFNSRAIFLSSVGHRLGQPDFSNLNLEGNYNPWVAYASSKTANLWTANEIDRRYGSRGLHAWAVHPGGVATGLAQHLSAEEIAVMMQDTTLLKVAKTSEQGAATTVWVAVAGELEGKGGRYMEECGSFTGPWDEMTGIYGSGYGVWAYDEAKEGQLWKESLKLVGLEDEL